MENTDKGSIQRFFCPSTRQKLSQQYPGLTLHLAIAYTLMGENIGLVPIFQPLILPFLSHLDFRTWIKMFSTQLVVHQGLFCVPRLQTDQLAKPVVSEASQLASQLEVALESCLSCCCLLRSFKCNAFCCCFHLPNNVQRALGSYIQLGLFFVPAA